MGTTLVLRTEAEPRSLIPVVRRAIAELDQQQPVAQVLTLEEVISNSVSPQRFNLVLLGVLAAVALFLAAAGIYGVMTYSVSQRTHEIGIRMALGARRADVLKLVVREGMWLVSTGLVAGLLGALALTRVLSSLLFGISATDPVVFVGIALCLTAVSRVACYLPARRALKVDPMVALRHE
jgi:putative ABC transport system permease protein